MPQSLEYPNFYFMSFNYNLINTRFGKLTVISFSHIFKKEGRTNSKMWNCLCDCGNTTIQSTSELNYGRVKSCGCLKKDGSRSVTHGQTRGGSFTPEYRAWQNMRTRCYNPKATRFEDHGGRGIGVCDKWRKFSNFYADMGDKPSILHSLERIDNNGNYEPSNCRWATAREQASNRRNSVRITYNGITMIMADWVRHLWLKDSNTLKSYIKRNGVEKAMLHYANRNK